MERKAINIERDISEDVFKKYKNIFKNIQLSAIICLHKTWHNRDKDNDPVLEGFESPFNSGDLCKGNGYASF